MPPMMKALGPKPAGKLGASTPLDRTRTGKLKSKKAKIGGECSQAMSDWKTNGMTPRVAAILGRCRSRARLQGKATDHANAGREGMAANLQRRSEGQYVTVKERLARAKELRAKRAGASGSLGERTPAAQPTAATVAGRRPQERTQVRAKEYRGTPGYTVSGSRTKIHVPSESQARAIQSMKKAGASDRAIDRVVRAEAYTPDRLARAQELRAQRAAKPAPAIEQPAAYSVLRPRTQALLASMKALRAKHGSDGIAHAKDLRDTARNTENALYSQRDNAGARRYARVASRAASLATDSPKGGFYGDAGLAQWRAKRTPYKLERGTAKPAQVKAVATATPAPSLREIAAKPDVVQSARIYRETKRAASYTNDPGYRDQYVAKRMAARALAADQVAGKSIPHTYGRTPLEARQTDATDALSRVRKAQAKLAETRTRFGEDYGRHYIAEDQRNLDTAIRKFRSITRVRKAKKPTS
jgi:hypothetical protein